MRRIYTDANGLTVTSDPNALTFNIAGLDLDVGFTSISFQNGSVSRHGRTGLTSEVLLACIMERVQQEEVENPTVQGRHALGHMKSALDLLIAKPKEFPTPKPDVANVD